MEIRVLNPGFVCIIKFKLISILAKRTCIIIAVEDVGEAVLMLFSDVLDTKGEGVGWHTPLTLWGLFGDLGTKSRFLVHYKV